MSDEPRPQALEYERLVRPSRLRRILPWVVAAAGSAVLVAVLVPSLQPGRHDGIHYSRIRCASNLRQIGQGVMMYANENKGVFPDSVTTLLLTQDLTSEVFVCGATNDTRATGATTQAVAANLTTGGHLSYVYVGKGMTVNTPPTAVLAYEPLANHPSAGMNVLYADGTVVLVAPREAIAVLNELAAGHNPPRK